MAIKTPIWAHKMGAFPTARGWEVSRPKGRTEVVRSATFSAADIAEWHGHSVPAPAPAPEPVVQTLHEAPVVETVVEPEEIDFHYGDDEVDHDEE
jgi:hypothetical protein